MAVKFEYDLNRDFVEVKEVVIEETLTEEDIADGLEPEMVDLKVAITKHANERMNDTEGRDCEWSLVEEVITDKSNVLFQVKNGEEFVLINDSQTIALVCEMHQQKGMTVLVLVTVIRNVYFDTENHAYEKKVRVRKGSKVY